MDWTIPHRLRRTVELLTLGGPPMGNPTGLTPILSDQIKTVVSPECLNTMHRILYNEVHVYLYIKPRYKFGYRGYYIPLLGV